MSKSKLFSLLGNSIIINGCVWVEGYDVFVLKWTDVFDAHLLEHLLWDAKIAQVHLKIGRSMIYARFICSRLKSIEIYYSSMH